jgi:hypothetical protein
MVPIGALCYNSIFLFRDDLKKAISEHPLWILLDPDSPPIFDIYVSEFNAPNKKTKMLFVSAKKSRQEEVSDLFKSMYDGTQKNYPNATMMLFIPLQEIKLSSPDLRKKIIFNHEKYIGDETLFSIGGLQDLNTKVKLRNDKVITLRHLLKSIPASEGMSRPQLFQQAEPNFSAVVTIVTFQAQDHALVVAHQATLESKICQAIADGEEDKVFSDPDIGLWFGGVNRPKLGKLSLIIPDKSHVMYSSHLNRVMNSPPKKRSAAPPKWGEAFATDATHLPPQPHPPMVTHATSNNRSGFGPINDDIDKKFELICTEINHQRPKNSSFESRIVSLETTTKSIASKWICS